ncbi:hypothetical protein EB796_007541 [Bugula neritina]|uniref:Uncharacterized protein n=1 Tax=Bugula neritina TaxID=10212 RepID=A0A7J7K976_BUGNE|nr:hypothetical protein EB796_007541 [Bugula neritina]
MWGQDEDDTLIDEQFKNLQTNLDTVIGETEKIDELTPVSTKGDKEEKEEKKTPKKKNKHLARCIRCIQDNRVKGGCVDPEEMADAAEDNLVLKKVLNIIFLLIGTLLFLAVVVVIIYTSSVKNKGALEPPSGVDLASAPNKTDYAYEYVPPDYDAEEAEINRYFGNNSNGKANFLKVKNSIDAMAMP